MPRGRSRDAAARRRILDATQNLVGEHGHQSVSINDIVAEAGVGKQTIYRWWPSRTAVVLDALVDASLKATPFPDSGHARDQFHSHIVKVIEFFTSPAGALVRAMLADSQGDDQASGEFIARFWAPRRAVALDRFRAGVARGELRGDVDPETALDVLYAPLWLRLMVRHRDLTPEFADELLIAVWPAMVP